jgi:hypothetical protein
VQRVGLEDLMPTVEVMLLSLAEISARHWSLAVAWHVATAAVLVATALGWRPARRWAALLVTAPLLSVSLLAFLQGNPFNGTVFALLTLSLAVMARQLDAEPVALPGRAGLMAAATMLAFAWVYPHFVPSGAPLAALYAAPLGLLPCPTLALAIGLTFLWQGFGSRRWSAVVSIAGLFYGLFGALRLGVQIDHILTLGAVVLGVTVFRPRFATLTRQAQRWPAATPRSSPGSRAGC